MARGEQPMQIIFVLEITRINNWSSKYQKAKSGLVWQDYTDFDLIWFINYTPVYTWLK